MPTQRLITACNSFIKEDKICLLNFSIITKSKKIKDFKSASEYNSRVLKQNTKGGF